MRWIAVTLLVATAGVAVVLGTRDATEQPGTPARDSTPSVVQGAGAPELTRAGALSKEGRAQETSDAEAPPAPGVKTPASPADPSVPAVAPPVPAVVASDGEEPAAPSARELRPGETFTPLSALHLPSKEEARLQAEQTRKRLQEQKLVRTTWSDVLLQDVLIQLSEQTQLTLALGPRALGRADEMRVSDPLSGQDPPLEPTVWNLLEVLARQHGLILSPWKGGVLMDLPPDPKTLQLRFYDTKDLLPQAWGNDEEIAEEDRLGAVFGDMIRTTAAVEPSLTLEVRNGIVIVRAQTAVFERIDQALTTWRTDPGSFEKAYTTFVSTRHSTVSGAPPRAGSQEGPEASGAGK